MIIVMVKRDDAVVPVEVESADCARVAELRQTFGDANVSIDGVPFSPQQPEPEKDEPEKDEPEKDEQAGDSDATGGAE